MSETPDLAINPSLFACRTSKANRQVNQVIRVRIGEGNMCSKRAKFTQAIIDNYDASRDSAALIWTDEELDIASAPLESLVVVVGEFLPKHYVDSLEFVHVRGSTEFDAAIHTTIGPIEGSFIIVRPIHMDRSVLYLLHGKQDGLSSVAPLPTRCETRIVYYHEWTAGVSHTIKKMRTDAFRGNLNIFCRDFRAQEFMGPEAEAGSSTVEDEAMDIQEDHDPLHVAIQAIFARDEEFGMKEAEDLVRLAKEEWSKVPPVTPFLEVQTILVLAKGLRDGALRDFEVPHTTWRALITLFCNIWAQFPCEDPAALKNMIETIYTSIPGPGHYLPDTQASQ
ncbi:hypothetical protein FALBO_7831 [Fusarium albosuccineum]|uniref:Uncharacterized protein n=1 Tax=Fusarium albosuccineum TaxID=1237068 RepID=A0A8H4PAG6_9HYPO|nr:hypothetical protein FALBO_7831 [Fusarium albosuccineum]